MAKSPVVILYDSNGVAMAVEDGVAIPVGTQALLAAGTDGSDAHVLLVDANGSPVVVGSGVAGTPAGGVLTIQGDPSGTPIPVAGSFSNPSVGATGAVTPASATQVGGTDGTNLQGVRVFDADTGAGSQYVLGTVLRKGASGGSVEAGTSSDPLRVDPTGTTTQPISTTLERAEDAPAVSGDTGVAVLGVYQPDTAGVSAGAVGDYATLNIDPKGRLKVSPGAQTLLDPMDSTSGWTVLNDDAGNLATTTNHVTGTLALTFDKLNGTSNTPYAIIQKTIPSVDLTNLFVGSVFIQTPVWLPSVANVLRVVVRIGTDSSNYNEWSVDASDVPAGYWNVFRETAGSARISVGNGWDSTAVTYIALGVEFQSQSDTLAGLVFDSLILLGGQINSSSLTAEVSTSVTTANINLHKISNKNPDTNTGLAGDGTLRVTLATDIALPTGDNTIGRAKITDGTNTAAVKAASTAAVATDPALVVAISPNNTITTSNASVGTNNAALPASSTEIGGSDGTNLQAVRVFDADTGAGTQYILGAVLRKSASGGSVEAGTSSDPLRVDPTGATTQPISAVSLPLPTGAATEATLATRLADATFTGRINTLGQKTMANSTPMVLASDQTAIPVTDNSGSITVDSPQLPAALAAGRLDSNVGAWLGSTSPTVGSKTSANSVPVVIASDQGAVAISAATLPLPTGASTSANQTTLGSQTTKVNDGTNTAAVKAASTAAIASDPALVVAISPNNTITTSNASVGSNGAALPTSSTEIGGSDGTNLQAVRVFDADTGGGTQYVLGTVLRKSASGGSVEAGTSSDPLRTDPTGTTTQPVSDAGGSLTVDTTQLPGALVGGRLDANTGAWLGSTAPTVGQKTSANSIPTVLSSDQTAIPVTDNGGSLTVDGTVTATVASTGSTGSAVPASATYTGFSDGTNLRGARVFDTDSGAGTEYTQGTVLRKSASGGSVEAGTSSDPLRTDPTGTTAQPVTDNGGSLTVDSTQLPAALVGGRLDENVGAWLGSTAPTVGQKTMANSLPMAIASDQGALTVTGTVTATNPSVGTNNAAIPASSTQVGGSDGTNLQAARVFDADTGGGTQYVLGTVLRKSASGGSVEAGTSSDPLRVDPTGSTTQPVSGTVTATQGTAAALAGYWPVRITDGTNTMPTADTVGRSSFHRITDGTNTATVKAASTAAVASDQALVVAVSPNNSVSVTSSTLALDATLTGGTQKAIVRGGAKGSTVAADVTSTASGSDHQPIDVAIYDASGNQVTTFGGGTQFADGAARGSATGTLMMVDDGTLIQSASGDSSGRLNTLSRVTDGSNTAAVKAASTAAVASDPALVVAISPNNPISVSGTADATGTGALGALNAAVQVTTAGLSSVGYQLAAGTLIGTLVAETSFDGGTTWNATFMTDQTTGIKASSVVFTISNTATARSIVGVEGSGLTRIRVSAYTSGTANITLRASLVAGDNMARYSTGGAGYTTLTSPNALPLGMIGQVTSYGTLKVTTEGSELFVEPFDGVTVDTTTRWTQSLVTGGTMTQASGSLTVATSTVASRAAALTSQNSFRAIGLGFQIFGASLGLEAVALTNNHRFWGLGTQPVSWAATTPIQDGCGFEQDTTGALNAVTYNAGTRTVQAVLTRPTDGLNHRYAMYIRADLIFWYLDTLEYPIATASWPPMGQQTLPIRLHSINHTSPPASAPTFIVMGVGMTETSHSGVQISDGQYAWRKSTVKPASTAALATDTALVVAVSPSDIATTVLANQTINSSGSATITGKRSAVVELLVNVTGTPTGTTPTLLFTLKEVDPQNGTTVIGNTQTSGSIIATGTYIVTFNTTVSSTLLLSWAVGGTSPVFPGVNVTLIEKQFNAPSPRVENFGGIATAASTMMFVDDIGSTTGSASTYLWTSLTGSTMNRSVLVGVLDINVTTASVANGAFGALTSNVYFPAYSEFPIVCTFKARVSTSSTNSTVAFGFGAPNVSFPLTTLGHTAAFVISGATPQVTASFGAAIVSPVLATLDAGTYYTFKVLVEKAYARYIVENSAGNILVDFRYDSPAGTAGASTSTHMNSFMHVFNAAAVGTAPTLRVASHQVDAIDKFIGKPWAHQQAISGRGAYITPRAAAQAAQCAEAAPANVTPVNTTSQYSTLGGEFLCTAVTGNENIRGVFGFLVLTPGALHITDIMIPLSSVSTAMGATISIHDWILIVNSTTNAPNGGTGQRIPLGTFTVAASATVGTIFSGTPLIYSFSTPIVALPNQHVIIAVKYRSSPNSGAFRGSCMINGYYD